MFTSKTTQRYMFQNVHANTSNKIMDDGSSLIYMTSISIMLIYCLLMITFQLFFDAIDLIFNVTGDQTIMGFYCFLDSHCLSSSISVCRCLN